MLLIKRYEVLPIFSFGCQYEQHIQENKLGEKMMKFNNSKQITINKQQRLGSHEELPLLISLVHLILCYIYKNFEGVRNGSSYKKL
jgi:hypothetical protein